MTAIALGADAPILAIMSTMRAMRRLKPDPVPEKLLTQLVQAATWAPSGSNAQCYQFVVVTDRAKITEIAALSMGEAASIYPGVQNLLLTARALGLGATLTTWHQLLEPEFKKALGIPRSVHAYAIIPIGWPRGRFGSVTRHDPHTVIHHNTW